MEMESRYFITIASWKHVMKKAFVKEIFLLEVQNEITRYGHQMADMGLQGNLLTDLKLPGQTLTTQAPAVFKQCKESITNDPWTIWV